MREKLQEFNYAVRVLFGLILMMSSAYAEIINYSPKDIDAAKRLNQIAEQVIDSYAHYHFEVHSEQTQAGLEIQIHYHYLDRERILGIGMKRANNLRVLLSEASIGLDNLHLQTERLEGRKFVFVKFMQVFVDSTPAPSYRPYISDEKVAQSLNKTLKSIVECWSPHSLSLYTDHKTKRLNYLLRYTSLVEKKVLGPGGVRAMALKELANEMSIGFYNRNNPHRREDFFGRVIPLIQFEKFVPGKGAW